MDYTSYFFAFLAFLTWGGLFVVYYRHRIFPWIINHFTRDKTPKASKENSLFGSAAPLPFKYETEKSNTARDQEIERLAKELHEESEALEQKEKKGSNEEKNKEENT